ncbi:MAG TPA: universal stress protein, partial [Burkholderiales bacterium]|nr:universal stress protein [Burkholderiales bacterium]
ESFAERVPERRKGEQYVIDCGPTGTSRELAEYARLHDLTIVPVYEGGGLQWVAETLVFDAGRPVLLLPKEGAAGHQFNKVVVGWDGGRSAARALADAIPWLARARSVTVVVITGEKPVQAQQHLGELQRHLDLHDVAAECVEEPADGLDAGSALLRYCDKVAAELLVMGAYGHSRIRDFVLGGATRTVVSKPSLPVLLSH